jgi:uncharacterized protein YraI
MQIKSWQRLLLADSLLAGTIAMPLAAQTQEPTLVAQACGHFVLSPGMVGVLMSSEAGSPINIRYGASPEARIHHIGYAGDRVTVLGRTCGEDSYAWYNVRFPQSGAEGWVRSDLITYYENDR